MNPGNATSVRQYAPTATAPPGVKQKFADELQNTLDGVPTHDILILLSDFNARVGKRDRMNNLWQGTLGIDERNDAGEEFLEFCAMNHLTIMNSWFEKKDVHLGTWMHPATRTYHNDYVVMCASQRKMCNDIQVMRGVNCWSDQLMVRVKVSVRMFQSQSRKQPTIPFVIYIPAAQPKC